MHNWSASMGITELAVCISPLYHSVEIKVVVGFWHRVENPFIPRQPGECLLTTHCVGIRIFKFLDYTVPCTACLCGSECEVSQ